MIEPVQFFKWAAPIIPVMKPDGKVRVCGDYKVTVNRAAKVDKYPIPKIEDLFNSLSGGKRFSKIDLSHAYMQIELDEAQKSTLRLTPTRGCFDLNVCHSGSSQPPPFFKRIMENLLQGIPGGECVY